MLAAVYWVDAGIDVLLGTVDGLDVAVRSSVSIFRMLFFSGLYFGISRIYIGALESDVCHSEVDRYNSVCHK